MAEFQIAADVMVGWRNEVLTGKKPVFYPLAQSGALSRMEIGPRLITLIGGAPGAGKTAFVMQAVIDALRLSPGLHAVVCNIEMPPEVLLDRQLARLSGVSLDTIRHRNITESMVDRINSGLATIEQIADRLCFIRPPFDLVNIAGTVDSFTAGGSAGVLLVLDYIQRIAPPGASSDKRSSLDLTMNYLRAFAHAGAAVMVISSVGRQKDKSGGSTYAADRLNLASFKESGELEFGADDAYILAPFSGGLTKLSHLKARHRGIEDIYFRFHGATQHFEESAVTSFDELQKPGALTEELGQLWSQTKPKRARGKK